MHWGKNRPTRLGAGCLYFWWEGGIPGAHKVHQEVCRSVHGAHVFILGAHTLCAYMVHVVGAHTWCTYLVHMAAFLVQAVFCSRLTRGCCLLHQPNNAGSYEHCLYEQGISKVGRMRGRYRDENVLENV